MTQSLIFNLTSHFNELFTTASTHKGVCVCRKGSNPATHWFIVQECTTFNTLDLYIYISLMHCMLHAHLKVNFLGPKTGVWRVTLWIYVCMHEQLRYHTPPSLLPFQVHTFLLCLKGKVGVAIISFPSDCSTSDVGLWADISVSTAISCRFRLIIRQDDTLVGRGACGARSNTLQWLYTRNRKDKNVMLSTFKWWCSRRRSMNTRHTCRICLCTADEDFHGQNIVCFNSCYTSACKLIMQTIIT